MDEEERRKLNALWEWRIQVMAILPAIRIIQILLGIIIAGAAVMALFNIRPT